jgi:hypothetical protein
MGCVSRLPEAVSCVDVQMRAPLAPAAMLCALWIDVEAWSRRESRIVMHIAHSDSLVTHVTADSLLEPSQPTPNPKAYSCNLHDTETTDLLRKV